MSRYYQIQVFKTPVPTDKTDDIAGTFTSHPGGTIDPGALDIEIDIPVYAYATPVGSGYVRLYGTPQAYVGQANKLSGKGVRISAGMKKGLPLANPNQSGKILDGTILQGFANWQGLDLTCDLILAPPFGSPTAPLNVTLNWQAGQNLGEALKTTLQTALPAYTVNVAVSPNLVLPNVEPHAVQSVFELAQYADSISKKIINDPTYRGVQITSNGSTILVSDGTKQQAPNSTAIAFTDLIGQPTWIDNFSIRFQTVMRADLHVGDVITMPKGNIPVTTTPQSLSQYRNNSVFQGNFSISDVRHVGRFRAPDGNAWVTVFNAYSVQSTAQ